MTDYYILKDCVNLKVIGQDYPQCVGLLKGYVDTEANPFSLYRFADDKGRRVDYVPDLKAIKIGQRTILTDFISRALGPARDCIVSKKVKKILERFRCSEMQIFECLLHRKEEVFRYNWLHFVFSLEQKVDFERSQFTHPSNNLIHKAAAIKTYMDFVKFYDEEDRYGFIRAEKTVIKCEPLDFFIVGRFNQNLYISNALREAFFSANVTGYMLEKATDIYFND